jgi:hypothetical protein
VRLKFDCLDRIYHSAYVNKFQAARSLKPKPGQAAPGSSGPVGIAPPAEGNKLLAGGMELECAAIGRTRFHERQS